MPEMAEGRFELAMEPMAIGMVSLNSNSETHMTARLIYGRGWISRVFICCTTLKSYGGQRTKLSTFLFVLRIS